MGRRRTRNHDLPPGVHRKGGRLYYGHNDTPLGVEGPDAWAKWARLRGGERSARTFADAVREFELREIRKRAPKTVPIWRRDRDSNPGYVAVYLISSQAPSTTRPSLRGREL